jgi:hypothetical protein
MSSTDYTTPPAAINPALRSHLLPRDQTSAAAALPPAAHVTPRDQTPAQATPRAAARAADDDTPAPKRPKRQKPEATQPLYLRVPQSMHRNLKLMAFDANTTISEIVVDILAEHVPQMIVYAKGEKGERPAA